MKRYGDCRNGGGECREGGASVLFEKGKEGLRLSKRRRRGMLI